MERLAVPVHAINTTVPHTTLSGNRRERLAVPVYTIYTIVPHTTLSGSRKKRLAVPVHTINTTVPHTTLSRNRRESLVLTVIPKYSLSFSDRVVQIVSRAILLFLLVLLLSPLSLPRLSFGLSWPMCAAPSVSASIRTAHVPGI